ncbi:heme oxygenase (biliverdin-producing) [Modestobacter versicolor]|uniref:Heme oxygenase n=1 Tax=Modestobacter versicolor TaxID=429133 RepID=A0A323VRS4_9ACTN|nr:biliverdin-producing heme oxygenase [Modestobacter versicolor]MBB3675128.1 heme oxygenase [Modestobacter versicolor]PZA21808.1 biliverdin-producing heme oxygenase [Modestobacter versicolor]
MTSTAVPTGFAARLRTATQADHTAAEGSAFVDDLLSGRLPRTAYAALLAQTHLVYDVLEQAVAAQARVPEVQPFLHPGLVRLPSLAADLEHLLGPAWREALVPLPATQRYVDRLREVAFDSPARLVAHHYLRYLGDLSGGQVIRRLVGRAYGLELDGVRFHVFDALGKAKPFKDAYRAALDAAPWTPEEQDQLIAEVAVGYRLNAELFRDLGARHAVG